MFTSHLRHYRDTLAVSDTVNADSARIELPDGGYMDGVVVFGDRRVKLTLTDAGAWQLAEQLANILDSRATG